jgi:hypothetical protein
MPKTVEVVSRVDNEPRPAAQRPGFGCWKGAAIGCGVLTIAVIALMAWMVLKITRVPGFTSLVKDSAACQQQMVEINGALDRYAAGKGEYPKDLKALVPDYLATSRVFHCPADSDPAKLISYVYSRPPESAPGTTVVLTCMNHRLPNGSGVIPLRMRKDGQLVRQPVPMDLPKR